MRVVLQKVKRASVRVAGEICGTIGPGLLVFVGIAPQDGQRELVWMCEKILKLRIFLDAEGKMNRSVSDVGGGILVVSQFTLYGDASRGTRPGFSYAAPPDVAEVLYENMKTYFREHSPLNIQSGQFGAMMDVELINDGPVTILLEKSFAEQST